MQKKGVSQIVSTILIILLVLAAIVIVWGVVERFVRTGEEAIIARTACMDIRLSIVEANSSENNVTVTRMTGGDTDAVNDIKILVEGTAATVTAPGGDAALEPLETKTYDVTSGINAGDKVEVAAVLEDETICDITDEIIAKA